MTDRIEPIAEVASDEQPKRKHPSWKEREAKAAARVEKPPVDFASVPPSQWRMHDRLENWARSVRGGDKQAGAAAPMFVLYKSSDARRDYGTETAVPVDRADARAIAAAISAMRNDKARRALNWYYARGGRAPGLEAVRFNVDMETLRDLVHEGRILLIESGV